MDWKTFLRKYYVYPLALLVFAVAAVIYCSPAITRIGWVPPTS